MKRVWGYNHLGPESLGDQRCKNTDCDPLLNDVEQAMVVASLTAAPPMAGCGMVVKWPTR
jgi:hypothetical protein